MIISILSRRGFKFIRVKVLLQVLGFFPTTKSGNPVKQAQIRECEVTNESGCVPKQVACCVRYGEKEQDWFPKRLARYAAGKPLTAGLDGTSDVPAHDCGYNAFWSESKFCFRQDLATD